MERYFEKYREWLERMGEERELLSELSAIAGRPEEIEDRFYREMVFGTGGMRGVMGAGINRMNVFTVGKVTQSVVHALLKADPRRTYRVAISYDSRINSRRFAMRTAEVFAANGVHAFIYPKLMPTPALSFAVRHLHCDCGIMITASHNPRPYNGYKVYNATGSQITDEKARRIQSVYEKLDLFSDVHRMNFEDALREKRVEYIGPEVEEALCAEEIRACPREEAMDRAFKIVYTPLNGAGISCVPECLKRAGFSDVVIPMEQGSPDGNFPTCPKPNPELEDAMRIGLQCAETHGADLLLATDPDCDRVGVASREDGGFRLLSGNEVGVLLFDYLCRVRSAQGRMPARPLAFKTIVTTQLAEKIAAGYGVELRDVLTGFKYIGEQIDRLEARGEEGRFLFGFEESCGYLNGTFVRDKDGINAALMIAEMFAWHRQRGATLHQALQAIYDRYGYCRNRLLSYTFEGPQGMRRIQDLMCDLRKARPARLAGIEIRRVVDYQDGIGDLPRANVLRFEMDGAGVVVRPSGTEPKIKVYISTVASGAEDAGAIEAGLVRTFEAWIKAGIELK